ncbi:MAG: TRAP-type C4-dicarboxylate transport system, small permease component [Bacillota bacterium]|jgi:TRAP-type C4-dicarboxylate transport system permease small subunit|nr:TRAP-type C4-dicarboxylate transport system, small permease component [Bacillota bacterium]
MSSFIKKVDHRLEIFEKNVVGYATIAMVLIMFINVVLRNFFQSGLVWGNEVSSYLNILAVYIAVSAGFKYGSHVGISVVVDYVIPRKLRKGTSVLTNLISLSFCILILYMGCRMMSAQMASGQSSPVISLPLWVVYGFLTLGMLLSAIRIIMEIIKIIINDTKVSGGGEAC